MKSLNDNGGVREVILNPCFGKHIATIIKTLRNKEFKCTHGKCSHTFIIKEFKGCPAGKDGYYDKYGKQWFVFVVCPKCSYEWSAYELLNRLVS